MSEPDLRRRPDFRHVFVFHDGETLIVPQRNARRIIDVRGPRATPETLWEVTLDSGLVRRVWLTELRDWRMEEV